MGWQALELSHYLISNTICLIKNIADSMHWNSNNQHGNHDNEVGEAQRISTPIPPNYAINVLFVIKININLSRVSGIKSSYKIDMLRNNLPLNNCLTYGN